MKNAINTLIEMVISDSKEFIIQNGGNVAEYLIADAESADQGWLWFLSDEEIEEFENGSSERRSEIISEIQNFINSNYDYNLVDENIKVYKVTYSGNASKFRNFEMEVTATSEREAVEDVYGQILDHSYFPQEDGSIKDCDGEVIASPTSDTIDYDGGCFSAEEVK